MSTSPNSSSNKGNQSGSHPDVIDERAVAKVLVVDDESYILKLIQDVLRKKGYYVELCDTGESALKKLQSMYFDCLITDSAMPGMSGLELVRAVRSHHDLAEVPILMLTKKRGRADIEAALDAGVTDYLLKPIDDLLLIDKVAFCVHKGLKERQLLELSLMPSRGECFTRVRCAVIKISEADITVRLPFQVTDRMFTRLEIPIFDEMEIAQPELRLIRCDLDPEPFESKELTYVAKYCFVALPEEDTKRVRAWIQREELKRRK